MSENANAEANGVDPKYAKKLARRKRIDKIQRTMLQRMSDRQIEQTIGTGLGMKLLFRSFESMYSPKKAGDFRGEIEFTFALRKNRETVWTLNFMDDRAESRAGASRDPALRISSPLAEFLRIGTGLEDAGPALTEGRLKLEGDFTALAVIIEMLAAGAM